MTTGFHAPIRHSHPLPRRRLWLGAGVAAAGWAVHGLMCVLVSTQACKNGAGGIGPMAWLEMQMDVGVGTLVFPAAAVAGGISCWRNFRAALDLWQPASDAINWDAVAGLGGVLLSTVFAAAILRAGIPLILLKSCIAVG